MKGIVDILRLVVSIMICQGAGLIGSIFTRTSVGTWYVTLRKPSFNPPSWLFGPVWITLYAMMGVSLFFVWRKGLGNPGVRVALTVFAIQLVLNVLWSVAFFGLNSPLRGFIVIVVLWSAILLTVIYFWRVSTAGALLLLPYMAWVSFALVLNFRIWRLN